MNFLAHLYLSFDEPDLMVGQFIADSVKGKQYESYPRGIANGILLHRLVDHMTDVHPACRELRAALRPELGLVSPVAMDLYLDHVLARDWQMHHPLRLSEFSQYCYALLQGRSDELPGDVAYLLSHMSTRDWLTGYSTPEGIQASLRGMARRFPSFGMLNKAAEILPDVLPACEEAFTSFFPELVQECRMKISTFAAG